MAEVLITLGIIGVVAALTLPTLISKHKKQVYVNQLKKVVNTLENAAQASVADEGVSSFQDTLLRCVLSDGYFCGHVWKDEYQDVANKYLKILNIYVADSDIPTYKYINGDNTYSNLIRPGVRIFKLNDGAVIYVSGTETFFFVDVNGDKGPNVYGRDLFELEFNSGNITNNHNGNSSCTDLIKFRDVLEMNSCVYAKIVADGWKMNY